MTALSDYMESGLLHHLFRGTTFPKPENIALALCSGVPQDSDTGATIPELPTGINGSGTGYARYDLGSPSGLGDAAWDYDINDHNAGSGQIKNSATWIFNTALIDWGWVSGIAIVDSGEYGSGNLLMYAELGNPRIVYQGDAAKFDASQLQIRFK
jgi:hypothetical protein